MAETVKKLIRDYFIHGSNIGTMDASDAVDTLLSINGDSIIEAIFENREFIRPIVSGEIPQFSNEKEVYNVLRILIESGLSGLTYEQVGEYLCSINTKPEAMRKYGETHYKFASQLGLTKRGYPLSPTEIGIAFFHLASDSQREASRIQLSLFQMANYLK